MKSIYSEIAYCVWNYHNINGSDEDNSSISQFCKGNDLKSNMIKTKLGWTCVNCYDAIPEEFIEDITIKQRKKKK